MDRAQLDELVPLLDVTAIPRVITWTEALQLGFTPAAVKHRLATNRWRRILPRTYLTADSLTWADRQLVALAFAGPQAVLSGAAALTDQGLRCVGTPPSVLVLVPTTVTVRSTGWVRIRRTDRCPAPALLPGPRRAPLARAVADLALEMRRLDDVRTLVAQATRRQLCTTDELLAELVDGPRNGSAWLRIALADVGAGAWSAPEGRAARLLRAANVPPFEQNAVVRLASGRRVIVDFLWRSLRAILEIDSVEHHLDPSDWRTTMDRHLALATAGYSVVHRTPAAVNSNPEQFTAEIVEWLRSRARTGA